jgi:integrase
MRPTPTWDGCSWRLDLRPLGLGRYVVDAPAGDLAEAVHAARDIYERELSARAITDAQLSLPGTTGRTFGQAMAAWLKYREGDRLLRWKTPGGERWTRCTAAALVRDLGPRLLRDFAPPGGGATLLAYRDEVRARAGAHRVGPRAMQDRLIVVSQLLRWCADPARLWIPAVPNFPDPRIDSSELLHNPLDTWVDEATFRAVRAAICASFQSREGLRRELVSLELPADAAAVDDRIARRRLYLSFAFYTGMRRHDLNLLDDRSVSPDFSCFVRFGRKTGVRPTWETVCAPLGCDLDAERARLGRDYRLREQIAAGPWERAPNVIAAAAAVASVQAFDLRTCRRSYVMHKALAGVAEADLIRLMGHKDSAMIRGVYLQVPPRTVRDAAGAAWPVQTSTTPGTGQARILQFTPSPTEKEG